MKLEKRISLKILVSTNAEMTPEEFEERISRSILQMESDANASLLMRWHIEVEEDDKKENN